MDNKTLNLIILMISSNILIIIAYQYNFLSLWIALPLAVLIANLSFTGWHECAHNTLSKSKSFNEFVGYFYGFLSSLIYLWIIPRLLIVPVHAYYICYFPHHDDKKGYKVHRIRKLNKIFQLLTVYQNFHGLHHLWPTIPWHRYEKVFEEKREELKSKGIEII